MMNVRRDAAVTTHDRFPPETPCFYGCGRTAASWDHFFPRSAARSPYPTPPPKRLNKVPACEPCNKVKGQLDPRDWLPLCPPAGVPNVLAKLEELARWLPPR